MNNKDFLDTVTDSFDRFLNTNSRSNEKLKVLHGNIAADLQNRLGNGYMVSSLGLGEGKEEEIKGRYIDKKVDITISKNGRALAGIGVKFVMQNYKQNSNNYFENMLGETANIRSNNVAYFQIFIIPDKMPYYSKSGDFEKWEEFDKHNIHKYLILSGDNIDVMCHTPNKTLLYVIHLPEVSNNILDRSDYIKECKDNLVVCESTNDYGRFNDAVVCNDYDSFISKVVHYINYVS